MPGELLTRWTIRVALALYALVVASKLLGLRASSLETGRAGWNWERLLWTAACGAFLVHLASAMHFYHGWSNQAAVEDTARQTEALFGWRFGEGIYFSYGFAAIWVVDVAWSWIAPTSYRSRGLWLAGTIHVYLFFIAFNGAVIFESGPTRPVGLLATGLLACCLLRGLLVRKSLLARKSPAVRKSPSEVSLPATTPPTNP